MYDTVDQAHGSSATHPGRHHPGRAPFRVRPLLRR